VDRDYLVSSELELGYHEWCALLVKRQHLLNHKEQEWLAAWDRWDFAVSPMEDERRRLIRSGHHRGWFAHADCKAT